MKSNLQHYMTNRLLSNMKISKGGCLDNSKGGQDETDVKIDTIDDNIYINVNKYNPLDSPNFNILSSSNITQAQALLLNPSDYRICCERFTIPSSTLPLFIYPSDVIGENLYKVEVFDTLTNISVIKPLIYEEWNIQYTDYARGVYYYDFMLTLINKALSLCYIEASQNPLFPILPANVPKIFYEHATQLFYWNIPSDFLLYFSERIQIRFSLDLYDNYFASFAGKFYKDVNHLEGQILFIQNKPIAGMTSFNQYNQSPCIGVWSSASKILILSNTIPITGEIISSSNNKSQNVLMDFEISPTESYNTEPFQFYSNLHRWYDMISTQPLFQLQITCQIVFRDGSQFPMRISRGEFMSFKFLIRSKTSQLTN